MYESPSSLLDLCLDCICERHAAIFSSRYVPADPAPPHVVQDPPQQSSPHSDLAPAATSIDDSSNSPPPGQLAPSVDGAPNHPSDLRRIFAFPDPDFVLLHELSEKLLQRFDEKHLLTDSTLALFSARNTRLRRVRMRNAHITPAGLSVLRHHQLTAMTYAGGSDRPLSVGGVLHALGGATLATLTHLDVSRCTCVDIARPAQMAQLARLKRLRSLNAAFTELGQTTLALLCAELPDLDALDLSGTRVHCLQPLLPLRSRMRSLALSDLRAINQVAATIVELDALRHLDISLIHERHDGAANRAVVDILSQPSKLGALESLDVSGWRDHIPSATLAEYMRAHPRLAFLGVVHNAAAFDVCVATPQLHVAGLADEAQIARTLRVYAARHGYVQKALYHLFQLSDVFAQPRPDVVGLVVDAMRAHPTRFGAQMAATACLYNLTRGELARRLHPRQLADGVRLTLAAMERFPDECQLQKNALLTLCSDRILQDVRFERYRCARLVLDALCAFDDVHMNRMCVAICSILAAKISTAETSVLGARAAYMRKLLAMVRARVDAQLADVTLKFTLSALWNLTDESAPTCAVFLAHGGADLFLDALRVFRQEAAVETKVLGLLNNIAEVRRLRAHLLSAPLVRCLRALLAYETIDVSYFAAGIVAHLATDGDDAWPTAGGETRADMLDALEAAVVGWGVPDNEMVSYRSFRPFFPLLADDVDHRVQLWAIWAMHHVCTKNASRYCSMLLEEDGVRFLEELVKSPNCHLLALAKCTEMLQNFEAHALKVDLVE